MAKSIRSKWKRKCRAIKRERYGQKELARLKKTLGVDDINQTNLDVAMTSISDIVEVKDAKDFEKVLVTQHDIEEGENDIEMTDGEKKAFNTKTYRDKNGAYPVWMHPRRIRKNKKKMKQSKKPKSKKAKKK